MPPVRKVKPDKTVKPAKEPVAEKVVSGQLDKKLKKLQQTKKNARGGVIFIKHLPHGFFEEQLKGYFEQFGKVTRLRLARSKRTGGSKGYAFVEFEYPEVAQVAAETMDNYLMFKKVVKASYIPPEKQPYNYFKTSLRKVTNKAGREIYISSKTAATQRKVKEHNDWSDDAYQKRTSAKLNKVNKLNEKYAHLGIDFSNIVVHPKKLTANEKVEKATGAVQNAEVAGGSKKAAGKRKTPIGVVAPEQKKTKTLETKVLLDNTINTDSEDEDYIAKPEGHDEDESTSDEETYGFTKDSDDDDDGEDDEADEPTPKSSFGKSMKPSKVDRYEQLLKRKPHVGGIEKTKKTVKKPAISKAKSSMKVAAAKAIAKPLSTIKNKANVKSKAGRKLQKV